MAYRILPALRPLVLRGSWLAIAVRLAIAVALALPPVPGGSILAPLPPITAIAFGAICGLLMLIDSARRRDLVLFANLGVSGATVAMCAAIPALVMESIISLVASR